MRYAIVRSGIVENVVVWDGGEGWSPPEETQAIACSDEVSAGWTHADGAFSPPPVAPPTLQQRKAALLQAVGAEYDARVAAGVPYEGKRLQIDTESRTNLQGVVNYADKTVAGVPGFVWPPAMIQKGWRMKDNSYLPMPAPEDIYALAGAAALHFMGLRYAAAAHKDAIVVATEETIGSIDVTQGWP